MEAGHDIVDMIARLFNFAVMAGTLVYFLKSPIAGYLRNRGIGIRSDLVKAAEMRATAAADLVAIDARMAALPAELDALRKTGAEGWRPRRRASGRWPSPSGRACWSRHAARSTGS